MIVNVRTTQKINEAFKKVSFYYHCGKHDTKIPERNAFMYMHFEIQIEIESNFLAKK